jgi:hypothetical protein
MRAKLARLDTPAADPDDAAEETLSDGFEALAGRLEALAARAVAHAWAGWSETDARDVEAAASEIRAIPKALAQGMKEAFTIGREYGHREEALDDLNREIATLSNGLARQAWGRRGTGWA